ncbi:MAG: prepilin-type N-terminal cleavage/methylation domain-containing protein [Gammaproteobacteria bacterium]|nr:MAG: prepilin-type N-terminal cleavage/methylation domain-containing protein [Gammaproteobacteria bacterium]
MHPHDTRVCPPAAGFSLTELLVSLAILAGLASLAGPGMVRLVQQERSTAALNQLLGAVHLARSSAITRGAIVTLCPSANGQTCAGRNRWHEGAIVFSDEDRDGRRDPDDALLRALPGFPDSSRVYWRSFRNKSYLQINGRGMTNWQNGHFLYCPANGDPRLARQLILNAQARVRKAPDRDGDGIAEDANGDPLECP